MWAFLKVKRAQISKSEAETTSSFGSQPWLQKPAQGQAAGEIPTAPVPTGCLTAFRHFTNLSSQLSSKNHHLAPGIINSWTRAEAGLAQSAQFNPQPRAPQGQGWNGPASPVSPLSTEGSLQEASWRTSGKPPRPSLSGFQKRGKATGRSSRGWTGVLAGAVALQAGPPLTQDSVAAFKNEPHVTRPDLKVLTAEENAPCSWDTLISRDHSWLCLGEGGAGSRSPGEFTFS